VKIKKIRIVSSSQPNGLTWIVNCLLELNYACYPGQNFEDSWTKVLNTDFYTQSKLIDPYERWLPNLVDKNPRKFRGGYNFSWSHDWNTELENSPTILFVRNPKSSILSQYKRLNLKHMTYNDYLSMVDPLTLISIAETNNLFYCSWLQNKNIHVIKFEDAKTAPAKTLIETLKFLNIEADNKSIMNAVQNSTSEIAQKTETEYLLRNNMSLKNRVSRKGSLSEWANDVFKEENISIDRSTFQMQKFLKYEDTNFDSVRDLAVHKKFVEGGRILPRPFRTSSSINDFKILNNLISSKKFYKIHKFGYISAKDVTLLVIRTLGLQDLRIKHRLRILVYLVWILFRSPLLLIWERRGIFLKSSSFRRIYFHIRKS
jgi:hypothetical protein